MSLHAWPSTASRRAKLAHFMIRDMTPHVAAVELLQMCASGFKMHVKNQMYYVVGTGLAFEAAFEPTDSSSCTVEPTSLVLLALHIAWLGFEGRAPIMASFVQQSYLVHVNHPFWTELYSHVAWIIVAPPVIVSAMAIGRPDVQLFVQRAYMQWLQRVRTPKRIEDALHFLLQSPIAYMNWTTHWTNFSTWTYDNALPVLCPKGTTFPGCKKSTKITKATVTVNGIGSLLMARSDAVLIIMRHLWDPCSAWAVRGCPEDAPDTFKQLDALQPYLFDSSVQTPSVAFDELTPFE